MENEQQMAENATEKSDWKLELERETKLKLLRKRKYLQKEKKSAELLSILLYGRGYWAVQSQIQKILEAILMLFLQKEVENIVDEICEECGRFKETRNEQRKLYIKTR